MNVNEILQTEKEKEKEYYNDLYYIEDCNNCKDADIRGTFGKTYTSCKHPWYCHDENQDIEFILGQINIFEHKNGYLTEYHKKIKKDLLNKRDEIVKRGLRKWRIEHLK